MSTQNLCCKADYLIRSQCSVCPDIHGQFIVIGYLTYTGILDFIVYTVNRCVDRIYCDHTDRHIICFTFIRTDIASALGDGQFHIQFAVCTAVQGCDNLIRIHDYDIGVCLDISSGDNAFAFILDVCNFRLICFAVVLNSKGLDIHDDLCNVFFYSRN